MSREPDVTVEKAVFVRFLRGNGTKEDPTREVTNVYDLTGRLIATSEPKPAPKRGPLDGAA